MYKFISSFLLLVTLLLSNPLLADVSASVDRNKIGLQETLYYTFSVDSISLTDSPDFSALLDYFEIVESSQQNNTQIINGSFSTTTTWKLALLPKKTGNLYIPPITFDGKSSKPILITVTDTPPGGDPLQDIVLLTAEIDKNQAYTNEQILLTVTLYTAVNLSRHTTLSDPDINNALVKELQTKPGQEEINGVTYQTLTKQFAIFPQETGDLVIPELHLQGKAIIPSRNRYEPFNSQSVIVRRQTKPQNITVLPKNDEVSPWLASKNVQLNEQWSSDKTTLQIGNSITRTIIITAMGVTGEAIPDITLPETTGFKVYSEAPQTENQVTPNGIEGKKIFRFTLIANQSGDIEAPPINVPWWDTKNNKKQTVSLKSKMFTVAPSSQSVSAPVITPLESSDNSPTNTDNSAPITPHSYWFYLAITFAILWAITLLLFAFYWIKRRGFSTSKETAKQNTFSPKDSQQAYKQLQQCSTEKDFTKIKSHLFIWLQSKLVSQHFTTVDEGLGLLGDAALQQAFNKANARIYKEQTPATTEDIKLILDCVKRIEENTQTIKQRSVNLYKD